MAINTLTNSAGNPRNIVPSNPNTAGQSQNNAGASTATNTGSADTVRLTEDSQLLQSVESQAADLPAVREQRVAEIRQALDAGTFNVDADAVAGGILRLESALFGS